MPELFGQFNPLLVIAMIAGLVEFAKKFNVSGNNLTILSMVLGVLFGVGYQLMAMYPAISPWIQMVVYGVLFGLTASGLYDMAKSFSLKS